MIETSNDIDPAELRINRFRYLFDIAFLIFASTILQWGVGALFRPNSFQSGLSFGIIDEVLLLAVAWLLVRWRGEGLADLGLKPPEIWTRTMVVGVGYAAVAFAVIYLTEKAGIHRNLSAFREVQ